MWGKRAGVPLVMILILPASLAFTACGVDFSPPWFAIPSSAIPTGYLFVVDSQGDIFLGASSVTQNASSISLLSNALMVYSYPLSAYIFALNPSSLLLKGSIYDNQSTIPTTSALVFNAGGTPIASITSSGSIYGKGIAVYANAQAGCPSDGIYCNTASGDIYTRDYYCDPSNWTCNYSDVLYEDCNDFAYDSDGYNLDVAGTCTDYNLCTTGDTTCPYTTFSDTCTGNVAYTNPVSGKTYYDTVREYVVDSTGKACVYTDVNVFSCSFSTSLGGPALTVCDGGKRTEVSVGCCRDADCLKIMRCADGNPYCDTFTYTCACGGIEHVT